MMETLKRMELPSGEIAWRELGEGPPLVLLHGWAMSHAVFSELALILAAEFRLLLPDLPGHGDSTRVEPCSLAAMSAAIGAWLRGLELIPVGILGWSLGGQVAMSLGLEQPALVERMVLVSTTPRFCSAGDWTAGLPSGELRALQRGLQRRYLATMGEFFDLQFMGENLNAERRREILGFAVRSSLLPAPNEALEALAILGKEDLRGRLSAIHQPTLVIHGEMDRIVPCAAGRYLAAHIAEAGLLSLQGIGHAPFLSDPERIAAHLRRFFQ